MFSTLQQNHPAWYITIDILLHLISFAAITSVIVFILRGPMRKHKAADMHFFERLRAIHSPRNNRIMKALTFLGKHQFLIPANLLLMTVFYFFGNHWYAFNLLVLSLSSLLLMFALKHLFHRRRPKEPLLFEARGLSFPSGHAIMSVCFYGLLLQMLLHEGLPGGVAVTAIVLTILLVLLIAFSRIYLQVHYLSDVLAGLIIGTCWLYAGLHVFGKLEGWMVG